jgi:hypothetical protein
MAGYFSTSGTTLFNSASTLVPFLKEFVLHLDKHTFSDCRKLLGYNLYYIWASTSFESAENY